MLGEHDLGGEYNSIAGMIPNRIAGKLGHRVFPEGGPAGKRRCARS